MNIENLSGYFGGAARRCGVPYRWLEDFVQQCWLYYLKKQEKHGEKAAAYAVNDARRWLGRQLLHESAGAGSNGMAAMPAMDAHKERLREDRKARRGQ